MNGQGEPFTEHANQSSGCCLRRCTQVTDQVIVAADMFVTEKDLRYRLPAAAFDDFQLRDYEPYPHIKAPVAV